MPKDGRCARMCTNRTTGGTAMSDEDARYRRDFVLGVGLVVGVQLVFMAGGLFKEPVQPVAYAQAEIFNGIDGLFMQYIHFPYRVWTTWGWHWEPRLTHGSFVPSRAGDVLRGRLNAGDMGDVAMH